MSEAKRRAEEVAALPHVERWVARFRKLAAAMPPEVWVYVASGTPHVMATDAKTGCWIEREDGRDGAEQDAVVASLVAPRGTWDGGDW